MPARQFRLRTLLLAVTVLCLHFALAAWSVRVVIWLLPCSTFCAAVAVTRNYGGATVVNSIGWGIAAATCFTALVIGSLGAADPYSNMTALHLGERFFIGLIGGACFGFVASVMFAAFYALIPFAQFWFRNRPDLYYVETDSKLGARHPRRP